MATYDPEIRRALFDFLDGLVTFHPSGVRSERINEFTFGGQRIRPIDRMRGIRKLKGMTMAIAFSTTYRAGADVDGAPYDDAVDEDGLLRYKWEGEDASNAYNLAMREAMHLKAPLVYFRGIAKALYVPIYPVFVVHEEHQHHEFWVSGDGSSYPLVGDDVDTDQRRYVEQRSRRRIHQPVFRAKVLRAYGERCAACQIGHAGLLDAAHILSDRHPMGQPVVANGLAFCKLHHAAFDLNFLGVRPDLVIEVRNDVLEEKGAPMLTQAFHAMHQTRLLTPTHRTHQPDAARLAIRYEEFLAGNQLRHSNDMGTPVD